jgi:hypothetical protein
MIYKYNPLPKNKFILPNVKLNSKQIISHIFLLLFCLFFSTNFPAICLLSDMAECKVLKFSSHLAHQKPQLFQLHSSHRLAAQSHQRVKSTLQESNITTTPWLINITCLPQSHPTNVTHNKIINYPPQQHQQPLSQQQTQILDPLISFWNQLVSIVVVLVIIMSLVVIKIASQCVLQQSHLWISSQRRKLI